MDNTVHSNRRRASESEAGLALVSGQPFIRITPPLPYLPSDYQPSPESPRRNLVLSKRQRSQTTGPLLTIEQEPSSSHFELVPYREWTVISQNSEKGQVVLYNPDSQSITVQRFSPDYDNQATSSTNLPAEEEKCPYCYRPLAHKNNNPPEYMDQNYFRLLASTNEPSSPTLKHLDPSINLNQNAFNQGYYSKFFVQLKKLGKGFRGSVFLCEHMLDGVKLGKYAVKKVAIGDNHDWLVNMLREVHLLERTRHANIVTYKHSWLESCQLSSFGPEVPCLFILMECANGGNLEEYFEPLVTPIPSKRERIKRQEMPKEKRLLTMTEIGSLFLDIVKGLAHLHQQNIVHRDLKPPNLLLQYDQRKQSGYHGIPRVLISDFGECEDLDRTLPNEDRTGATGTLEFMAPEHVLLDARGRNMVDYSPKADMWSLGMVLYYLCYSRLPYNNIDDMDLLRQEILAFQEVVFPKSRLDIYKDQKNPLYVDAVHNSEIDTDIPHELKLLMRLLLSVDPVKRPSCNEILVKIRERTNIFNLSKPSEVIVEESLKRSDSSKENSRKRPKTENYPLLMDLPQPSSLFNENRYSKTIKSVTAAFKIASCTYSCSPYSTKPILLYPVIFLATLDFWHDSNSPSLILLVLHVVLLLFTFITTGGFCQT